MGCGCEGDLQLAHAEGPVPGAPSSLAALPLAPCLPVVAAATLHKCNNVLINEQAGTAELGGLKQVTNAPEQRSVGQRSPQAA